MQVNFVGCMNFLMCSLGFFNGFNYYGYFLLVL